jgi:hypothetical protein
LVHLAHKEKKAQLELPAHREKKEYKAAQAS